MSSQSNASEDQLDLKGGSSVTIGGGVLVNLHGTPIDQFDLQFTVDADGPRVIASSVAKDDVVSPGVLTYTAQFDEPLDASTISLVLIPFFSISYTVDSNCPATSMHFLSLFVIPSQSNIILIDKMNEEGFAICFPAISNAAP